MLNRNCSNPYTRMELINIKEKWWVLAYLGHRLASDPTDHHGRTAAVS
jgi:hypothetical protein